MKIDTLMNVLEVLIMVSDTPLPADKLCNLVDHNDVSIKEVKQALEELATVYEGRGIQLKKVGRGYRFQAREEYRDWFHKLFTERPAKYSRALLETLAIIAYRQPVTRADVEAIRGVAVSTSIMRTLLEREWVKVVGHRDVPGKPSIYATTKVFLDYFNLARLDDLPPLSEVKELADIMEQGKQSEISLKLASEGAIEEDAVAADSNQSDILKEQDEAPFLEEKMREDAINLNKDEDETLSEPSSNLASDDLAKEDAARVDANHNALEKEQDEASFVEEERAILNKDEDETLDEQSFAQKIMDEEHNVDEKALDEEEAVID
jgi:segregation and condensation protein B